MTMRRLALSLLLGLLAAPMWGQASRHFDGTNDAVACGDIDALEGIPNLTVGCWINLDDNDVGTSGVISKGTSATAGSGYVWALHKGATEAILFKIYDGTAEQSAGSSANLVTFAAWHHAVGTYARTPAEGNRLKVYLNGVLVGGDPTTNDADIAGGTALPVTIGHWSTTSFWDGPIAHCFAEPRAWSAVEIAEAYRGGLTKLQAAAATGGYLPLWDNDATPTTYIGQGLLAGACSATNHPAVSSDGPRVFIPGGGQ